MAMLAAVLLAGLLPAVPASGETLPPLTTLQLSATSKWTDSLGTYHVVGQGTNGDPALTGRFIKVACTIHDQTKAGNPALTTYAYTEADLLKPVEKSPVEVSFLATNVNSSLGPLQQVAFTFERFPGAPAWTCSGNGSIGSLAEAPAPTTDVTPSPLAFAPQIDLIPSLAQTVSVSNIGTGDLHV